MRSRSKIAGILLLIVMSLVAVAKEPRRDRLIDTLIPPALNQNLADAGTQQHDTIARLLAFEPQMPLGPVDVLREYEEEMNLVAQKLSEEMLSISNAVGAEQITRVHAEYLIQERYQAAMMQHEVLSALHYILEHDVNKAETKRPNGASKPEPAVAVQPLAEEIQTQ
jgi:hypothetical protein